MQLSGFSLEGPHCLSAVSGTVDQKRSLDEEGPVLSLVSMCSPPGEVPAGCVQNSQGISERSN